MIAQLSESEVGLEYISPIPIFVAEDKYKNLLASDDPDIAKASRFNLASIFVYNL